MSKMIFVCSPASDEQKLPATRLMCYFIASHGHVPIVPRLYFPQFITQADSKMVEAMMSYCDEVWAIGEDQTEENNDEIAMAGRLCIPIVRFESIRLMAELLDKGKIPKAKKLDFMDDVSDEDFHEIADYAIHRAFNIEERATIDRTDIEMVLTLSTILRRKARGKVLPKGEDPTRVLDDHIRQISEALHMEYDVVWLILKADAEDRVNESHKD